MVRCLHNVINWLVYKPLHALLLPFHAESFGHNRSSTHSEIIVIILRYKIELGLSNIIMHNKKYPRANSLRNMHYAWSGGETNYLMAVCIFTTKTIRRGKGVIFSNAHYSMGRYTCRIWPPSHCAVQASNPVPGCLQISNFFSYKYTVSKTEF
jgi:hypothetical protein